MVTLTSYYKCCVHITVILIPMYSVEIKCSKICQTVYYDEWYVVLEHNAGSVTLDNHPYAYFRCPEKRLFD